jgi:hypothetical protein
MATKSIVRGGYETFRRQLVNNPTKVTIGGASAASAALSPGDYFVKSDVDCYVKQGAAPVATTSTDFLRADYEIVVTVKTTGVDDKIAVIQSSSGGTLWIKDCEAVD